MKCKSSKSWLIALCFLMACLIPCPVKGADEIGGANVRFSHSLGSVEVSLYHAAQKQNGSYVPTEQFKNGSIQLDNSQNSHSSDLAGTLYSYVRRQNLKPVRTIMLDESGQGQVENLDHGLYLVTSPVYDAGGIQYFVNPTTVELNPGDDLMMRLKLQLYLIADEFISIEKVWKDENGKTMPAPQNEVNAELLRDGVVMDTVSLNGSNGWKKTWNISEEDHWTVMEKNVPEGYRLTIEQNGLKFRLVNQKEKKAAAPDPDHPDQPDPDDKKKPVKGDQTSTALMLSGSTALIAANLAVMAGGFLYIMKKREN